jgi:uncharacterized membrane protein YjgN (DUF898 family)
VDLDEVHVLTQVLQDYIHDNEDEDDRVAFHIVDKVDNNFVVAVVAAVVVVAVVVVVVVVRKQQHLYHDHMDMHLQEHNNLYFRKNHYKEFFCIKNLYLLLMVDEQYLFDVMVMNVMMNRLMNGNRIVEYV